jgi:phage replication-related protein YjqB (UPF0714/DUF867 family)
VIFKKRDKYLNFNDLVSHQREGIDFEILAVEKPNAIAAIIAPHAGGIEAKTGTIAKAIAGMNYSLYCFEGTKSSGNRILHITSHHFDEPRCLRLIEKHQRVITIHGCKEKKEKIYIGGLDKELIEMLISELSNVGIIPEQSERFSAKSLDNICNRGLTNRGVQFELSLQFRTSSRVPLFVKSVRSVLSGISLLNKY